MTVYDKSIGNELYQVPISSSILFNEYIGCNFSAAALASFEKSVTLIGVKSAALGSILIHPGKAYILVGLLSYTHGYVT